MSQKKVDAYKAGKATRAERAKKEQRERIIETGIAGIIALAVLVWMGFSVVDKAMPKNEETVVTETVIDTTALDEYVSTIAE